MHSRLDLRPQTDTRFLKPEASKGRPSCFKPLTAPTANVNTLLPYHVQRETLRGQAPYHWRCPTPRRAHPWLSAKPVPKLPRQRQKMRGIHNTKKAPRKDKTKHPRCQSLSRQRVHVLNGHLQRSIWPEVSATIPVRRKGKRGTDLRVGSASCGRSPACAAHWARHSSFRRAAALLHLQQRARQPSAAAE